MALNCIEQRSTAPNDTRSYLLADVLPGQRRYGVPFHTGVLSLIEQQSTGLYVAWRGVSAGQSGKDLAGDPALQVGADWVQLGEVVTTSEVLTEVGRRKTA